MKWPNTNISLAPRGSQIFILAITIVAVVCFWLAEAMLTKENLFGLLFFGAGVICAIGAYMAFCRSHTTADLADAPQAQITESDGRNMRLPSSILFNKDAMHSLGEFLQATVNRHPLPMPSGKVNVDHGTPLPDLEEKAIAEIQENNLRLSQAEKEMIEALYRTHVAHTIPDITPGMRKAISDIRPSE